MDKAEHEDTMQIKIKRLHPAAKMPEYATDGAACFDLYATTVSGLSDIGDIVYPGYPLIVGTGWAVDVPPGYMLRIASRSGLAFEHHIQAFPGVIDSDYRGEIKVLLTCSHLANDVRPLRINPGDRIAQAYVVAVPRVEFVECDTLSNTPRGDGGFGSTGT